MDGFSPTHTQVIHLNVGKVSVQSSQCLAMQFEEQISLCKYFNVMGEEQTLSAIKKYLPPNRFIYFFLLLLPWKPRQHGPVGNTEPVVTMQSSNYKWKLSPLSF